MSAACAPTASTGKTPAESALPYSLALSILYLVFLCLAYSINAADRQIFPTLLPAIREAFGYDLKIAGLMSTVFTLGLAIAGIPTGYLLDRASRKSVIIGAMLTYSVFTMATVYAQGFWDMLFYRSMTGIGEAMQMAGLFAAVGCYFQRKRSFFIGWMIVAYGVGAFLGPRLGSMLSHGTDSWKTPFVWFAVTGMALAAIVLLFVPKGFTESRGIKGPSNEATLDYMPMNLWNRNVVMGAIASIILGFSLMLEGVCSFTLERSSPEYIGALCTKSCELPMWQSVHVRLSRRLARCNVSLFRPGMLSTVRTIAGQPAF